VSATENSFIENGWRLFSELLLLYHSLMELLVEVNYGKDRAERVETYLVEKNRWKK
jgi:hypothetical protein